MSASAARVYHRQLDPNGQDSLAKLARLIRPDSRVLDLGAGPGVLGRYLTEQRQCAVDGVEGNADAASEAAPWYRRLQRADLEQLKLAECFAGGQYDFIVCADVLEHLRRPHDLLAQLSGLLAPNGRVLASVPNVAYAGLIAELLAGDFRYRPEGLLDETHLRFFTLRSLLRALETAGLRAVAVDAVMLDPRDSEFADRYLDALPPALRRGLLARPEALVYQFIVSAQIAGEAGRTEAPLLACPPPELRFSCQLFWSLPETGYRESDSTVAWGRIGQARQTVRLPVPALPAPPLALRLDFADRPGLLRLYALALRDINGQALWQWNGRRESLAEQPGQQLAFAVSEGASDGLLLLLAGDDPNLELPVPAFALAALQQGGELVVELSWPMSLDYLALAQDCIPRRDAMAMQAALTAQIRELEDRSANWKSQIAELEATLSESTARRADLERELEAQQHAKGQLEMERGALAAQSSQQTAEIELLGRSWRNRLWAGWRRYRRG
ncbi:MAG TPA: methyltransferase domain-containing protein [Candidatus Competibacter sp.]|nr:methyltransferase domain-containing protein [Candidatus Competibacter sp.]